MKNKTEIFMNRAVSLGLSMLEISKIVVYEFVVIVLNQNMEK